MRLGEGEHVVEERRRAAKDAAVSAEDNVVAGEQAQVGVVIAEDNPTTQSQIEAAQVSQDKGVTLSSTL